VSLSLCPALILRRAVPLVAALTLAACSSLNPFQEKIELPCPSLNVVPDADSITSFRDGPGRDVLDVQHSITLSTISQGCTTDIDNDTMSGGQEARLRPLFIVELGPAGDEREISFEYFVVVSDRARKVLYREEFAITSRFPANVTKIQVPGEVVILEIPIESGQTGRTYQIYAGLKLSREQLAYNREQRKQRETFRAPLSRSVPE